MSNLAILAGVAGLIALSSGKRGKSSSKSLTSNRGILTNPTKGFSQIQLAQNLWPDQVFSIPFGSGDSTPIWPIVTSRKDKFTVSYRTISGDYLGNMMRRFMSKRGDAKYHVGIDLYASHGDAVIACESGQIVNIYHFFHGAYAMIVQCNSGLVINYGEIANGSWKEFGVSKGSKVKKGQPIARIGTMSGGSSMLHFETYMRPSMINEKYFGGDTGGILNPTYYLLRAKYVSQGGRVYASSSCRASYFKNMPPTNSFEEEVLQIERALNVAPNDSIYAEIMADKFGPVTPDLADGP